jgi:glucose/arabinose dehydrogenase
MDDGRCRRRVLQALGGGLVTGLAGCGRLSGGPTATPADLDAPDSVALETVATGFEAPLDVSFAPSAGLTYVADQPGRVTALEGSSRLSDPVVDLRGAVEYGGEKGLLGIALHPDVADDRRLFVRYSAPRRAGTPSTYSHTFVLAEFRLTADGRGVVPDSERAILEIPEPQSNHNAGQIAFGPDGYLYVGVGDGGAGGDQGRGHVADWYESVGGGNGQDVTENLLGSLLRIDVDDRSGDRPYGIPDDNPLVGRDGLDEHYAWGLRNPWRLSFDGEDCYVGDVGQNSYEEVSLVERGGNYGWNVREGTHCFRASECPDSTPTDVRGGEELVDPVIEYPHAGAAVCRASLARTSSVTYRSTGGSSSRDRLMGTGSGRSGWSRLPAAGRN